jgi:GDSL-like lipase/acylhydrolase family protein
MALPLFSLLIQLFAPTGLPNVGKIPIRINAAWSVEVRAGVATFGERRICLTQATTIEIPPVELVEVRDEEHAILPVFNPNTAGWVRGAKLKPLIAQECTATGLHLPDTVCVKPRAGNAKSFVLGKDFQVDPLWATVGRTERGGIQEGQPVFLDYDYSPCRLDSIVADAMGKVVIRLGAPHATAPLPPVLKEGDTVIANVYQAGKADALTEENLFPLMPLLPSPDAGAPSQAERFLPKTLAKLRAGEKVTVMAWGDSVTNGGGVQKDPDARYENMFLASLKERFPKADITLINESWGGYNSKSYLDAAPGSGKNFDEQLMAPDYDLLTIEFVNDAWLPEDQVAPHYDQFIPRLREKGVEIALITPHLVRPDWMGEQTMHFDEDPRPYVKGLRAYALNNGLALADAAAIWTSLHRMGIPYMTLEGNWINHPNARGHKIFSETLMELFPQE